MTKYVEMTRVLRKATKDPAASDEFLQALEAREVDRRVEFERLLAQMREERTRHIESIRHAIYWAAGFLGLAMTFLGIAVTFFS